MKEQILLIADYIDNISTPEEVALFACQIAIIALANQLIAVALGKIHDAVRTTVTDILVDLAVKLSNVSWALTIPVTVLAVLMQKMGWVL